MKKYIVIHLFMAFGAHEYEEPRVKLSFVDAGDELAAVAEATFDVSKVGRLIDVFVVAVSPLTL